MSTTVVRGLVFDLDNTLLDRQSTFLKVARSFHEEFLRSAAHVTRDDAVARLVCWDGDGYSDRQTMLSRWLGEWPETGLVMGSLTRWYRSAMSRHVKPDLEVNRFLGCLNERQVPWGIVTNGSLSQHGKCREAGLDRLAPFIIVSEEAGYAKPDPRDISRRPGCYRARESRSDHVRRGQSLRRHRRGKAVRNEGRLDTARSPVSC